MRYNLFEYNTILHVFLSKKMPLQGRILALVVYLFTVFELSILQFDQGLSFPYFVGVWYFCGSTFDTNMINHVSLFTRIYSSLR